MRCRYRSTELLWQCPHCHEWNTFVEERIAPAKDTEVDAHELTRLTPAPTATSKTLRTWASVSANVPVGA